MMPLSRQQEAEAVEPNRPLLTVNNIEVIYDHVILVLKGVSLEVPEGGIVALLGANGAGKTTTLKAISNLLGAERGEVTKGSIECMGERVDRLSPNELVRRGVYDPHQVSAEVIKNWVRRNPDDGRELLYHNPSYVFFREVNQVPADQGPLGAMNRSVTTLRTVAVDPKFVPLGAPVWIEKEGKEPMHRLMIAQDTGSAIKGAQRADVFFGTGDKAGRAAGKLRDPGRMMVLMPIQRAYALLPEPLL
mgnify:CR=1 FL=1